MSPLIAFLFLGSEYFVENEFFGNMMNYLFDVKHRSKKRRVATTPKLKDNSFKNLVQAVSLMKKGKSSEGIFGG